MEEDYWVSDVPGTQAVTGVCTVSGKDATGPGCVVVCGGGVAVGRIPLLLYC